MQINQLPPAPQKRITLFSRELAGIFRRIVAQTKNGKKDSAVPPKGGSGHEPKA